MASTTAVNRPDNAEPAAKPKWYRQLYFWVIVAIVAGVLVGWLAPGFGKAMEPIGTTFVAAMRMLIGPIVFLTIIGGIAGVADLRKVGLTGVKALVYFQVGTLLALAFGLLAINLFPVGDGVNADASQIEVSGLGRRPDREGREPALVAVPDPHHPDQRWPSPSSRATSCRSSSWPSSSVSPSTPSARSPPRCLTCAAQHQGHVQDPVLRHEARPARRLRGDGLRDRQVRHLHPRQPRLADRPVLRDLGAVRARGARHGHGLPEVQHLQAAALPQGRAAARSSEPRPPSRRCPA